jgi:hypothetical protein
MGILTRLLGKISENSDRERLLAAVCEFIRATPTKYWKRVSQQHPELLGEEIDVDTFLH